MQTTERHPESWEEAILCGLNCEIEHSRLKHEYSTVKETGRVGCSGQALREDVSGAHQAEMSANYVLILTPPHSHSQCVRRPLEAVMDTPGVRIPSIRPSLTEMGVPECADTVKDSSNVTLPACIPCL